jgi:phage terminase large subunit-like protein
LIQENLKGEFITKTLNLFVNEKEYEKYLNFDAWKKCEVKNIDLKGKEVVVGVDLSLTTDITAVDIIYKEKGKYYLITHGFLPRDNLENRREKFDYMAAERRGECTICDGSAVDYNMVEDHIRNIESTHCCKIKCIASDPYNALQMMQNLANDYEVILLKQTYAVLSSPIKAFRDDVYFENVYYLASKLLDWMMSNTTTIEGRVSGDILLNKKNKNKTRIDLIVAAIFCYSQLYLEEEKLPELTEEYIKSFYS